MPPKTSTSTNVQTDAKNDPLAVMAAKLAALELENTRLTEEAKAAATRTVKLKVSEKGAISVYGMGRFPVTLYANQWEVLMGMKESFLVFIQENRGLLSVKAPKAGQGSATAPTGSAL